MTKDELYEITNRENDDIEFTSENLRDVNFKNREMYARELYDDYSYAAEEVKNIFKLIVDYIRISALRKDMIYINEICNRLEILYMRYGDYESPKISKEDRELFLDFVDNSHIRRSLDYSYNFDITKNEVYNNLTVDYLVIQGNYKQFLVDHNENTELYKEIMLL